MTSRRFRTTRTAAIAFTTTAALCLSACSGNGGGDELAADAPFKIGVLLGLTGSYAAVAEPQQRALQLFEKQMDEAGGIKGRAVDLVYLDSKSSESEAVNQLRRFATQENVIGVIGPSASGEGIAIKPIAQSLKLPVIAPVSSTEISSPAVPYMYRNFLSSVDSMTAQLEYAQRQGLNRVAMLSSNNAYGQEPARAFESAAEQVGVEVVAAETFAPDATDMTSQLSVIARTNPDVVLVWSVSPSNAIIARNARAINFEPLIFQGPGAGTFDYLELAGADADGTLVQAGKILVADDIPADDPQKASITEYAQAWEGEYDDRPSQHDGGAWDSALIMKAAIEGMEGNPASVTDARTSLEASLQNNINGLAGVGGIYDFSETVHGPEGSEELAILEVVDGRFTLDEVN